MGNNRSRRLFRIFLSFLFLTFSIFLLNTAPLIGADLPPLDSGTPTSAPLQGAYAPRGGVFLPQYGTPYGYGAPYGYGLPYQNQNMRPGFMLPAAQYNMSPFQAPGFNPISNYPYAARNPYLATNPYLAANPNFLASSDTSGSNSSLPPYDTIFNASTFPNQTFYGPSQNMYTPSNAYQQYPVGSPYALGSPQGVVNPFANPIAVPYGNIRTYSGALPQQGYPGLSNMGMGYNNMGMGYNPFQRINLLQQTGSPFGMNINPFNPFNPFQYNPFQYNPFQSNRNPSNLYQYNASNYYPSSGGSSNNNNNGDDTVDLPDAKGHWAGTWEAWLTDPNGVVTDPNGQIQITMSGDIHFHITNQASKGGSVKGTVEIDGWDVDPQPEDWPGNWDGEEEVVELTGWIDQASRYFLARYYYYPGKENSADYDSSEDPVNILGMYTWHFNSNKLTITDTGISGQFTINEEGYYVIGVFSTAPYQP